MLHCWLGLPRSRCRQCNGDNESGFTVVELVVALALMAIVMAGLAPAVDGALQAAANSNHRTVADSLAVASLEQVRSIHYYGTGYNYGTSANPQLNVPADCTSHSDPVFGTYAASEQPVVLDQGVASELPAFSPTTTSQGVTYTTRLCVYWTDSSQGVGSQSYKQTVASVGWSDTAGSHAITKVSAVYDCAGAAAGTPASNCTPPVTTPVAGTPDPPTALAAATAGWGTVYLTWVPPVLSSVPVDHYIVESNTTGVFTTSTSYQSSLPVYGTSYAFGGLNPGTIYYFQVISVASGGGQSTASNIASAPAGGTIVANTCVVSSISVTPTTGIVDSNWALINGTQVGTTEQFAITVNTNNYCVNVTVQYLDKSGTKYAPVNGVNQLSGTTLVNSTAWNLGADMFTVYVGGSAYSLGGSPVQEQVDICQEKGNSGKC